MLYLLYHVLDLGSPILHIIYSMLYIYIYIYILVAKKTCLQFFYSFSFPGPGKEKRYENGALGTNKKGNKNGVNFH